MPVSTTKVDLLSKTGMETRSVSSVQWVSNLWNNNRQVALSVRPGFGMRVQTDSTTMQVGKSFNTNNPDGGYVTHLGSFLYRSQFGRRQIISLFSCISSSSTARDVDMDAVNTSSGKTTEEWYHTLHGYHRSTVASIYDLTTGASWEELLPFKTAEFTEPNTMTTAWGHLEAWNLQDSRGFRFTESAVSFNQIGDSVYISSPDIGIWVYHGIDIPSQRVIQKLNADNPNPKQFAASTYPATNASSGYSEGSVLQPIGATRGINGKDVVYLSKGDLPRPVGAAEINSRVAYAAKNAVWFSDTFQPGAVMADNFITIQSDGSATAVASYSGNLYVFTEIETHTVIVSPGSVTGSPVPGLVAATNIITSKAAGCVSQRSVIETPFGVVWVSKWGVHLSGKPGVVETISNPISNHWTDGLKDPATNYRIHAGAPGSSTKKQKPIIYTHEGEPSVAWDERNQNIMVAYSDHILVYNMVTQNWVVWPLGVRGNSAAAPIFSTTFNCVGMLSDSEGVYLVSGLYDLNDTLSSNPFTESPSYFICEMGHGGARDRSIRQEDSREFGRGTFELLEPSSVSTGGAAALQIPGGGTYKNGHLLHITPVKSWRVGATSYKSYQIDFEVAPEVAYPHTTLTFKLQVPSAWSFVQASTGSFPESGPFSDFTVAYANAYTIQVTRNLSGSRKPARTPFLYVEISCAVNSVVDPQWSVDFADSTTSAGVESFRVIAWQAVDRFRHSNNRWSSGSESFDGATAHEQDIEWGLKTGELNLNGDSMVRIRGVRSAIESAGASTVSGYEGLYNVAIASDYKLMSGQWVDYNDPVQAEQEATKKQTLRDRMFTGKRAFNSVATWYKAADGVVNTNYLHDNPEVNEIDISLATRGESVSAMLFGRVTDKGEFFKLHASKATIQIGGKTKRYGR